jgi:NAD(P)-dependent dehydrogenase (short-subunit alcohol dehydrogenase family)
MRESMQSPPVWLGGWALVLGASSGFGEAASIALARGGLDVFGVHLDRKSTLTTVERIVGAIEGLGRQARFFNVDAADADRRAEVLEEMTRAMAARGGDGHLTVLLHSLAFGTLKPFIADPVKETTVNAIRAGVTPTPAAQKIPGYDLLVDQARRRNPSGRLTTPDDVARALVVLAHPDTAWITGNVIGVDGGEDIVG